MHWNAAGVVDDYGPPWTIFLVPGMTAFVYALLCVLPAIEPEKANIKEFYKKHGFGMRLALVLFFAALDALVVLATLGYDVRMASVMPLMIGSLIVYVGHIMRDAKRMYFVGFRTPWALANAHNWRVTHEFGGKAFVAAGIVCIVGAVLQSLWLSIGAIIVAGFATLLYSYLEFRRK